MESESMQLLPGLCKSNLLISLYAERVEADVPSDGHRYNRQRKVTQQTQWTRWVLALVL